MRHGPLKFFLVLIVMLWPPLPVQAQDVALTSDIQVDVMSTSPQTSKEKAHEKAIRDGFVQLIQKLAPAQEEDILKKTQIEEIKTYVLTKEVLEEEIAGNRYMGMIRVGYSASAINELIDKKAALIGGDLSRMRSTLVIPLYEKSGRLLLWEDDNLWFDVWKEAALETGTHQVMVPYGDGVDSASLTVTKAKNGEYKNYVPLLRRYGSRDVIVVLARASEDEQTIDVVRRYVSQTKNDEMTLQYRVDPQEHFSDMMMRAAADIVEQVDMRQSETLRGATEGPTNKMAMEVNIRTIRDWTKFRDKMKTIPLVENVEIIRAAPRKMLCVVIYRGPEDGLASAMKAKEIPVSSTTTPWSVTP